MHFRELRGRALTVDCSHDESDLHGVRGTCEVSVNLLGLVLVQRHKPVEDVVASGRVVGAALVVWEVVLHRADGQLLLEAVNLVEEEDDGCLDEPPRVADGVEQGERLLHAVDRLVLKQELVVLGNGDEEKDGGDVFKAVYPLLPLGTLATNVKHAVGEVADDEGGFGDARGFDTRAEDVLVVGNIVRRSDAVGRVEVASQGQPRSTTLNLHYSLFGRVIELVFPGSLEAGLDAGILPEDCDGIANLWV